MGILDFMFSVFVAGLIPLFSLGFGMVLARVAKEEIKPGMKYFRMLEFLLYIALFLLGLVYDFNVGLLVLAVILFLTNLHKKGLFFVKFLLFGIIHAIVTDVVNLFEIVISILFVSGLILATRVKNKNLVDVIFMAVLYYLIGYVVSGLIINLVL